MTYAEQLEKETEEARADLSNSLDELRGRLTPGQLIDQLTDGLRNGAPGEFARNLKDQAIKNPLPVAVMGVSLAWQMLAPRTHSGNGLMHRAADRIREAAGTVADKVQSSVDGGGRKPSEWGSEMSDDKDGSRRAPDGDASWMDSARQKAGDVAEGARQTAGSIAGSAQQAVSETYEGVADKGRRTAASIASSTKIAGRRTAEAGNRIVQVCREQPLLTTAIGIALGAFLGALAPPTDVENRVMGDTSDGLKENVKDLASEQYHKVERAGEQALGPRGSRESDAGSSQTDAVASDDKTSAGRQDRVTLVPEPTASGERNEQPFNADRSPI